MTTEFGTPPPGEDFPPLLPRVAAIVTRVRGAERDLLLVRAGTTAPQFPDATVALNETPADAVMRLPLALLGQEVARLERRIAVVRETLADNTRAVVRPTLLRTGPSHEATLMRFPLDRGMRVKVTEWQDEFARVAYEEYTFHENELAIASRRAGWLTVDVLAAQIEHHLFHLSTTEHAPTPVDKSAVWLPLAHATGLMPLHAHWLERARTLLTR